MLKSKEKSVLKKLNLTKEDILHDYRIAFQSREASLMGRTEVLTGKAKFGIFGDGKEVPQLAMARAFQKGDFRSGYYRDQTFMFARGMSNTKEFFAQLYANTDRKLEPASAGRQMNGHFSTPTLNEDGSWKKLTELYNSSADISPTASQMPRLVGLAYASKLYREISELKKWTEFSKNGNEIAFGTIGNASCAEGMFWEAINAIGVLQAPLLMSIWDDGYGISVPNKYQLTKQNISEILKGFQKNKEYPQGYDIYVVKCWDYPTLIETYQKAAEKTRESHIPTIIHVTEVTQPQGHSTSGSHERYKSKERLQWEEEYCCVRKMRYWMMEHNIATETELNALEKEEKAQVEKLKNEAWEDYINPIQKEIEEVATLANKLANTSAHKEEIQQQLQTLQEKTSPFRKDISETVYQLLLATKDEKSDEKLKLLAWKKKQEPLHHDRYNSYLHCQNSNSALKVEVIPPTFSEKPPSIPGFKILNACFDAALKRDPRIIAFGEDVGHIGDVNQGFAGLQEKHGKLRVSDTGIRECTIMGQAIGMAMRGLRPIAEIQYLDYLLYALQILSDDLATIQYRTKGGQKAPVIVRTRGHRLEGIWHSGSPMAGVIHLVRGIYVLVPRNMTIAAGFYNTLLQSDDPAIVVEVLNGYRLHESCPENIDSFTTPLGVPETIRNGTELTLVTYGASCRIAMEAAEMLSKVGIEIEIIDVQSLLPFDINGQIVESLKKTNRVLFLDEDVPGGTSAYMMQEVLEKQQGYFHLDSKPITLAAKPHRPAYGTDGNYWSKPNREDVFETIYELMHETDPKKYPIFYK